MTNCKFKQNNPLTLALLAFAILICAPLEAIETGVIETVAGSGSSKDDGGQPSGALKATIAQTFGVEIGPDGALYIAEVGLHRVRRLDLTSGRLTTVAGCGQKGYSGDGGSATEARLNEPYEVCFDAQGNMFIVEMKNHLVRRVDALTGVISTVAGTGQNGYSGDGSQATRATLSNPHSIALDATGGLYVADIGNHRIRRIDLKTGLIETIAGNGRRALPKDGQIARGKPILGPRALYIDGDTMWIALREGHSVWRLAMQKGTLSHVAGTGEKGYSGDGSAAKAAKFNGPKGIAVGPMGNVYVVDTENQAIRKIDIATGLISTVAGSGPQRRGFAGDGQLAIEAQLDRPHGVCVGPDGSIYIGDTNNHRVRRVAP